MSVNNQVKSKEDNLVRPPLSLKAELSEKIGNFFAEGVSQAMFEVQGLIRKVAPTKATVLLLGESGTGKTLVAKIIHELSDRERLSFVKVNCVAIPDNLIEAELFGYEKSAIAGATESKVGRFEEADGGTIFLDEIGEVPMTLQVKLLRFIQDHEFDRLGSSKPREADVRIIAATNGDLGKAVADGSFREDLYYTLNMFPITVPPLRERREDILPLINFFRYKICREYRCGHRFTKAALDALCKYAWPGNVREMENLIERLAIIFSGGVIDVGDLSPYLTQILPDVDVRKHPPPESLRKREKRDVVEALERNKWVLSRAARDLGITLRQMGYRVKKLGLEDVMQERKSVV